jgi:hypothetical protein
MNSKEFFRCRRMGIPYFKAVSSTAPTNPSKLLMSKPLPLKRDRPFGNHVGKEGGNPEYKKTVI